MEWNPFTVCTFLFFSIHCTVVFLGLDQRIVKANFPQWAHLILFVLFQEQDHTLWYEAGERATQAAGSIWHQGKEIVTVLLVDLQSVFCLSNFCVYWWSSTGGSIWHHGEGLTTHYLVDLQYILSNFLQCCGSGMFIPDPGSELFPSRIQGKKNSRIRISIKEF